MGVYDEYGYLGIQIKTNASGARYRLGESTPLSSGLYFGYEGVVVIDGCVLTGVYPYDQVWNKWGGWIGKEAKAVVEAGNPIGAVVAAYLEDTKLMEEPSMKPYWMVHRNGRNSGVPQKVHTSFESAYKEAERLTRKERDRFVILEAHTLIEPFEPLVITVETIGDPPAGANYPEPFDSFPAGPPEETEPTEVPCGYGCDEEVVSSNCKIHAEPEPCPAQETGRMKDCTCGTPKREQHVSAGCTNPSCSCKLPAIVTPIPTYPNCQCLACTTGVVKR